MKAFVIALLILAGLGAGGWYWSRSSGSGTGPGQGPDSADARPSTAAVERGNINDAVGVAGEIGPAEQVSVRPEVNGKIIELPVDVGDKVKQGGLLFALDDRDLKIEVESRQKQIESAKLQLDKARIGMDQAKRDYERDKMLFEEKLLSEQAFEASRQRYDSAVKDHDLAKNSIERSEKELDLSKERLERTRIVAPFDCTVLTRPVSSGQAVSGSGGFNSGTEVLTIADLSSMVINAHVNQADVTRLKQGMEVLVEVDAVPGLKVSGVIERIAPQAVVKNMIKGYATRIVLKDVDPRVQPGMTASISIPVSSAENVLTVPLAAVFSEQGERYVYVKNGDSLEKKNVVIGISDFFRAEVKSGLSDGDIVSLEPPGGTAGRIPGGGPAAAAASPAKPAGSTTASASSAPSTPSTTTAATKAATSTPTATTGTTRGTSTSRPGT